MKCHYDSEIAAHSGSITSLVGFQGFCYTKVNHSDVFVIIVTEGAESASCVNLSRKFLTMNVCNCCITTKNVFVLLSLSSR